MAELLYNCPRCKGIRVTFDVLGSTNMGVEHGWRNNFELCARCRICRQSSVLKGRDMGVGASDRIMKAGGFEDYKGALTGLIDIFDHVTVKDTLPEAPPEFLPKNINAVYEEGARCLAIRCSNAAATMFRLCIDLATKAMLPPEGEEPKGNVRRNLGLRMPWLFDNGKLPEALRDLATCIKEDGNDGAHEGTLSAQDAEDVRDFTFVLLERLYTEPARIAEAQQRRAARRAG